MPDVLRRARSAVGPEIERWLSRLAPPVRLVAEYHLGFADPSGRPTSGNGGKAVRPALALLCAEATGADAATALPGAVAVELVHNFSLLHDDVMDRDRERRHRLTAWALFGESGAILAGDALLNLAHQALLEVPSPARRAEAARADGRLGGRGRARDVAQHAVGRCLSALGGAPLADAARGELEERAQFVVEREF